MFFDALTTRRYGICLLTMLAVDKKKTDKVDLGKELEKFVTANYSAEVAGDMGSAFAEINAQREGVRNAHDRVGSDETAKAVYLGYSVSVLSMERRFPVSENHVRVKFTWYDAFSTRKKCADYQIYFEKASVLFNLGAHLSSVGAVQNLSSPEGLKIACQNFQAAAGAFQEAKTVVEHHPLPPDAADLSAASLGALEVLMLAQAQQCFYEKAAMDKMKPQITSKLAAQAADFYQQAHAQFGAISAVTRSWKDQVELKKIYFRALSQLQQSHVAIAADGYGEQVGRLVVASGHMADAKKRLLKGVPSELQGQFEASLAEIEKARAQAERENDTIYHDTVPVEARLAAIEAKAIVKPTPVADQIGTAFPDLFAKLIPFAVTEKLSIYQDRRDTLVRDELRGLDEANQIAVAMLSSMGLPGSIEALDTGYGQDVSGDQDGLLPTALTAKHRAVIDGGGLPRLAELKDTARSLGAEAKSLLDSATTALNDEEADDNAMRAQFGQRWTRTPSHQLTSGLRQDLTKHLGHLEHASKSDALVDSKFDQHQPWIAILSGSAEDVAANIPTPPPPDASQPSLWEHPAVVQLKHSLGELDRSVASRMAIRTELQDIQKTDDPSSLLLSAPHEEEQIYAQGLAKYQPHIDQLHSSIQQQTVILDRIAAENQAFLQAKAEWQRMQAQGLNSNEREAALQAASDAHSAFAELSGNLREGIQFYTEFQSMLATLRRRCEDFALARKTEKSDFVRQLEPHAPQAATAAPVASAPVSYGAPAAYPPGGVPQQSHNPYSGQQPAYAPQAPQYNAYQPQQTGQPPAQSAPGGYAPYAQVQAQQPGYGQYQQQAGYPPQQGAYPPQGYSQQPNQQGGYPQQPYQQVNNNNSLI